MRRQVWQFDHPDQPGTWLDASPKLMEPGGGYENYEACLKSPNGRFLPGGYHTNSIRDDGATPDADRMGAEYIRDGGFASARDVLKWWANTERAGGFIRHLLWVAKYYHTNDNGITYYFWDRLGNRVLDRDLGTALARGRNLPIPT